MMSGKLMRIKSSHWVGAGLQIPWLLSRDTGEPALQNLRLLTGYQVK